ARTGAEQALGLDRVVAAVAPGVAAQHAPAGEDEAAERAVSPDRLDRVARAGGVVLAVRSQRGRHHQLVEPDRQHGEPATGAHEGGSPLPATALPSSSSSAAATPASPSRSASSPAAGRATTTKS